MIIANDEEYQKALAEMEKIFASRPEDPEWSRMLELVHAIENYDEIHYPVRTTSR